MSMIDDNDFISRQELHDALLTVATKKIARRKLDEAQLVLDIIQALCPAKPVEQQAPAIDFLNLPLRDPNALGPRCRASVPGPNWYRYDRCTRALGHDGPCAHDLARPFKKTT